MAERFDAGTRISALGFCANLALAGAKFWAGSAAGSTALLADAIHSLADAAANIAAWFGLYVSRRPADDRHPYGHRRFDTEIARLVGLSLVAVAVLVGYHALFSVDRPGPPGGERVALAVALAAVMLKEALYRRTLVVGRRILSQAIVASAVDHRSDALASLAAAAGIVGKLAGYPRVDAFAAVFVAALILLMGLRIYKDATAELLDAGAGEETVQTIRTLVGAVPGVVEVQEVRTRQHGGQILVDLRIAVQRNVTVEAGHAVARDAKVLLMQELSEIQDVLVHVNPA